MSFFKKQSKLSAPLAFKLREKMWGRFGFSFSNEKFNQLDRLKVVRENTTGVDSILVPDGYSSGDAKTFHVQGVRNTPERS